jgi:hypothetical protein
LREAGVSAPIALVTGYADLVDLDSGGVIKAFLRKPFSTRDLEVLQARLRAASLDGPQAAEAAEPGGYGRVQSG